MAVSVTAYGWDDFMDGTLSRQLVCTGIFFVRSDFLAFLSSAAPGASHQHSKMVRKSYGAYELIDLDQHMKHRDGHRSKIELVVLEKRSRNGWRKRQVTLVVLHKARP